MSSPTAPLPRSRDGVAEARAAVHADARPLTGSPGDYDELLELIGDARIVLLGEGSHGTHEFYRERARITQRLIVEHGFDAVAVEADWPDAYRVNRYVRGLGGDADAEESLRGFQRFPTWMWRNAEVLDFVGWLRARNDDLPPARKAGFYGLDLYSLHASTAAVVEYLETVDPAAARRARDRYACFERHSGGGQDYGEAVTLGVDEPCRRRVLHQLVELRLAAADYLRRDGLVAEDEQFCAEQNASVVAGAEEYYRTMFGDRAGSWNLRDRHMADTLDHLSAHLQRHDGTSRIVVWAHNSHVGDARFTEMSARGELNVGQLMRWRHGSDVVTVGFTTYAGTVTAASDWGAPAERKRVRPGLPDSYESQLHSVGLPAFTLALARRPRARKALEGPALERAIGVIYRPESERASHYFAARLPRQFDAVVHIDRTRAVEPLERTPAWELGEPPETYPFAV